MNGRCSITGGYVYEGSVNTFPTGTYVYGDYCSGEIFAWDGSTQTVLTDTALSISSFGEDEQGELYVVNISGGSISRIASTTPCTYSISPTRVTFQVKAVPAALRSPLPTAAPGPQTATGPGSRSPAVRPEAATAW